MKKLFLLFSICLLGSTIFAKEQPAVIVHKSNGGFWAWLNLYNDILYTPSSDELTPATLDCTGAGFSACRVPHTFNTIGANSTITYRNDIVDGVLANAINELIERSEVEGAKGNLSGNASKTIAIPNGSKGSYDTYMVKGNWQYSKSGEATMYIYINENDLLQRK